MTLLAFVPLLAPVALIAVAILSRFEPGPNPSRVLELSRYASYGAVALSLLTAVGTALAGTTVSPTLGWGPFGLAVRLDSLSVVMFALVAFVGAVVIHFSRNYLDGDERHGAFLGNLSLTVACVSLLVLAGNLTQLVLAWVATSLALHRLLVHYKDRKGAVVAARKKFIVARIGDVCLLGATVLMANAFNTQDIGEILAGAQDMAADGELWLPVAGAATLVAVAAILKSAMFPTHGWLLEVMETPTPVSALLHAGIINGGTFLVVRFADVVLSFSPALFLLVLFGGFTALFASAAMVTQTSVKVSLAYSSAAHMGFMLMLCGLGAYSVAILHLVAHSFYKAHAFLSSGSIVDYSRAAGRGPKDVPASAAVLGASLVASFTIFVGLGMLFQVPFTERPLSMTLGAIFVMALTHLLARGLGASKAPYVWGWSALYAAGVATAFFGLETLAAGLLASSVPNAENLDPVRIAMMVLVGLSFTAVSFLQILLPAYRNTPFFRTAYVHLKNGLYANTVFDRWVGALR